MRYIARGTVVPGARSGFAGFSFARILPEAWSCRRRYNGLVAVTISQKVSALKSLGEYVGLWGRFRKPVSELPPPPVPLWLVFLRVFDEQAHPVQRHAAAMILEAYRPGWRGYCSPELLGEIVERGDREVAVWRAAILHRDGHRCIRCGTEERLHAHHIVPWADAPELRLHLDNGLTLCAECHAGEHPNLAALINY